MDPNLTEQKEIVRDQVLFLKRIYERIEGEYYPISTQYLQYLVQELEELIMMLDSKTKD